MTTHIALYGFKKSVTPQEIRTVFDKLIALGPKVPGLRSLSCASNTSKYSEGYDYVIVVIGESQAAIDAYRSHPDHIEIAKLLDGMEEKSIGVDFSSSE